MAESGTHDTLMARKGLYCDLVTSQTDGQREIFDEKTMVEYRLSRLESKTVVRRTSSARTKPSLVRQLTRLGSMGVPQTIEEPDEEDTPHAGEVSSRVCMYSHCGVELASILVHLPSLVR